jgi:hypothetical protein
MFDALKLMQLYTGRAYCKWKGIPSDNDQDCISTGKDLLGNDDAIVDQLEILAEGFENSNRKVLLLKVRKSYTAFVRMIRYYAMSHISSSMIANDTLAFAAWKKKYFSEEERTAWYNLGGQLVPESNVNELLHAIRINKFKSWDQVHGFYQYHGAIYNERVLNHAIASFCELDGYSKKSFSLPMLNQSLDEYLKTMDWIYRGIVVSREKDMVNPFRQMVYQNNEEMEAVLGKVKDNSFIKDMDKKRKQARKQVEALLERLLVQTPA